MCQRNIWQWVFIAEEWLLSPTYLHSVVWSSKLVTVNVEILYLSSLTERAIARHEVREIEQRHTVDGPRQDMMLDEEDDVVIIYNRVPKTASTSFTNIAYDLCAKNKYHVLHINTTKNNPVMSLQDQVSCFNWDVCLISTENFFCCCKLILSDGIDFMSHFPI